MKFKNIILFTLGIITFQSQSASGCDTCAVYAASEAVGESSTGWFLANGWQYTRFGTTQDQSREVPNTTDQYLNSEITQLVAGYGITPRFSVQMNLPFIDRTYSRPDGFQTDKGTVSGLGDASLTGRFLLTRMDTTDTTFFWNFLAGIKLPTGSSSRIKEEFHEHEVPGAPESGIHGHDLALGSGSFDGIIGTSAFLRYQRAFATAAIQYSLRTEGDHDYRYADGLSWEAGIGAYVLLEDSHTLALEVLFSGDHKKTDTFRGARAADTAINAVYLGPKLVGTWGSNFSAEIGVDLPLRIQNSAFQTVPDWRVRGGISWRF